MKSMRKFRADWLSEAREKPPAASMRGSPVPGKNENEIIMTHSHHDGWATNEATGASTVMALAKYFGQLPPKTLNRTLMFYIVGSHFGHRADWETKSLGGLPVEEATKVFNLTPGGWENFQALPAYRLFAQNNLRQQYRDGCGAVVRPERGRLRAD